MKYIIDTESLPSWEKAAVETLMAANNTAQVYGRTIFLRPLDIEVGAITTKAYAEGRDDGYRGGLDAGYSNGFDAALALVPERVIVT